MKIISFLIVLVVGVTELNAASMLEIVLHHENNFILQYFYEEIQRNPDSWLLEYEKIYNTQSIVVLGLVINLIIAFFVLIQYFYQLITLDKTEKLTLEKIIEMFFYKSLTNNIIYKIIILTFVTIAILKPIPVIMMKPVIVSNQVFAWTPDVQTHDKSRITNNANLSTASTGNYNLIHVPLLLGLPLNIIEKLIYGFDLEEKESDIEDEKHYYLVGDSKEEVVLKLKNKDLTKSNPIRPKAVIPGIFKQITMIKEKADFQGEIINGVNNSFVRIMGGNTSALGNAGEPIRKLGQLINLQQRIGEEGDNYRKLIVTGLTTKPQASKYDFLWHTRHNDFIKDNLFVGGSSSLDLNKDLNKTEIKSKEAQINEKLKKLISQVEQIKKTGEENGDKKGMSLLSNIILSNIFLPNTEDVNGKNYYAINEIKEELLKKCIPKITDSKFKCNVSNETTNKITKIVALLRAEHINRGSTEVKRKSTTPIKENINDFQKTENKIPTFLHGIEIDGFGYSKGIVEASGDYKTNIFKSGDINDYTDSTVLIGALESWSRGFINNAIRPDYLSLKLGSTSNNKTVTIKDGHNYYTMEKEDFNFDVRVGPESIGIPQKKDLNNLDDVTSVYGNNTNEIMIRFDLPEIVETTDDNTTINKNNTIERLFWYHLITKYFEKIKTPVDLFDVSKYQKTIQWLRPEIKITQTFAPTIEVKKNKHFEKAAGEADFGKKYMNYKKFIYQYNYILKILTEVEQYLDNQILRNKELIDETVNGKVSSKKDKRNEWLNGRSSISGYVLNPYISHYNTTMDSTSSNMKIEIFKKLFNTIEENEEVKEGSKIISNTNKLQVTPIYEYGYREKVSIEDNKSFFSSNNKTVTRNNQAQINSQTTAIFKEIYMLPNSFSEEVKTESDIDNTLYYGNELKSSYIYGNKYFSKTNLSELVLPSESVCTANLMDCIYKITTPKKATTGETEEFEKIGTTTLEQYHSTTANQLTELYYLNLKDFYIGQSETMCIGGYMPNENGECEGDESGVETYKIQNNKSKYINIERGKYTDTYLGINTLKSKNIIGLSYRNLLRELMFSTDNYIEPVTTGTKAKIIFKTGLEDKDMNKLNNLKQDLFNAATSLNVLIGDLSIGTGCIPNTLTGTTDEIKKTTIETFFTSIGEEQKRRCYKLSGIDSTELEEQVHDIMPSFFSGEEDINNSTFGVESIFGKNNFLTYDNILRQKHETFIDSCSDVITSTDSTTLTVEEFYPCLATILTINNETQIFKTFKYIEGTMFDDVYTKVADFVTLLYNKGGNTNYERTKDLQQKWDQVMSVDKITQMISLIGVSEKIYYKKELKGADKIVSPPVDGWVIPIILFVIKIGILYAFAFNIILILLLAILATILGWGLALIVPFYAFFSKVAIDNYKSWMKEQGQSKIISIIENVNQWMFKLILASTFVFVIFTMLIMSINVIMYDFALPMLINNYLEDIITNSTVSLLVQLEVYAYVILMVIVTLIISGMLLGSLKKWLKETTIESTVNLTQAVNQAVVDLTKTIKVK